MEKKKFLAVGLIGVLLAAGLVLFGCDFDGCTRNAEKCHVTIELKQDTTPGSPTIGSWKSYIVGNYKDCGNGSKNYITQEWSGCSTHVHIGGNSPGTYGCRSR